MTGLFPGTTIFFFFFHLLCTVWQWLVRLLQKRLRVGGLGNRSGSLCSNCIRSLEMQPALPAPQVASPQGPVAIFVLVFSLSHIMTPSGSVFLIFQKTHSNRISLFLAASSITMNKEWKPTRMLTNGKCVPAREAIMRSCPLALRRNFILLQSF